MATPAPAIPADEYVRSIDDPDFGELEVWRRHSAGRINETQEWKPFSYLELRGRVALKRGVEAPLLLSIDDDPEDALRHYTPRARATFRQLAEREREICSEAAARMFEIAVDWAESANRADLTLEQFAESLRIEAFSLSADETGAMLGVWLEDTLAIFAGHGLIAEYDDAGNLLDVALFG